MKGSKIDSRHASGRCTGESVFKPQNLLSEKFETYIFRTNGANSVYLILLTKNENLIKVSEFLQQKCYINGIFLYGWGTFISKSSNHLKFSSNRKKYYHEKKKWEVIHKATSFFYLIKQQSNMGLLDCWMKRSNWW